ncbi:peptide methionine sulfoxide reductase-like [Ptychodera flava]|uniref:peptide methionine sulfoxide reductase-like n=1 Tax=Ptychodera flava TaxID=63121 RepID=UPI00396AB04F
MKFWNCLLMTCCIFATMTTVAMEDEEEEDCDGFESQLLKHMFEKNDLPYKEPDVKTVKATFAMGCFWGVESVFGGTPGVIRVKCGYIGGEKKNPTYRDLGDHTEAVELEYDPEKTDFSKLLQVFWENHDPAEQHKRQYMSAIFVHDEEQEKLSKKSMEEQQKKNEDKIVTQILPAGTFYDAEDYHQKYFLRFHDNLLSSLGMGDKELLNSYRASRLLGYITGHGKEDNFKNEVDKLALTADQAGYVRKFMKNKDMGSCAAKKNP